MLFCHMVRMVKILRCVKAHFTKTVKTKLLNLKINLIFGLGGKKCPNFSFWVILSDLDIFWSLMPLLKKGLIGVS